MDCGGIDGGSDGGSGGGSDASMCPGMGYRECDMSGKWGPCICEGEGFGGIPK